MKAPKRRAPNAPVAICCPGTANAEDVEDAPAEDAPEAPEAAAELIDEVVLEVMVAAAAAELAATKTAVAFLVPHFSLFVHCCWPMASLGWLLIHWVYVAWQMKKGKVCS